jgi:lipoprotein-releasing system ATP-binding protein
MADLVVNGISKQYPTRAEPLVVLRDIDLSLSAGENLAIVGPSGCGKSTLLHILGTLDDPTTGSVLLGDINPFSLSEPDLAALRNRQIGFVFQDHHLLPQCSVLENVLLPTIATGTAPADSLDRARMLLTRVGLEQRLEHRPAELSGGERQRAAVARALVTRPKLVLADEPTGNLDGKNAAQVFELMLELNRELGTSLVIVTHDERLAARLDRVLTLTEGILVERDAAPA